MKNFSISTLFLFISFNFLLPFLHSQEQNGSLPQITQKVSEYSNLDHEQLVPFDDCLLRQSHHRKCKGTPGPRGRRGPKGDTGDTGPIGPKRP